MLISIVVPVHNAESHLAQCVESLLSQTYDNIEVILVNDGSTDCSKGMCDEYSRKDMRVHVVHQGNEGVSSARNRGMDEASGDYLMFVDADDWLVPEAVEMLVSTANGDCPVTLFDYSPTSAAGAPLSRAQNFYPLAGPTDTSLVQRRCLNVSDRQVLSSCWLLFIDRRALQNSGVKFNTKVSMMEDLLFIYELLQDMESVLVIDGDLYRWRQSPVSLSHGYIPTLEECVRTIYKRLMELHAPTLALEAWVASMCARIALSECRSAKGIAATASSLDRLRRGYSSILCRAKVHKGSMRLREYLIARSLFVSPWFTATLLKLLLGIKGDAR